MATLFSNKGSRLYTEKDRDIQERMQEFYKNSLSVNESFWNEADTDTRFEAGDQNVFYENYGLEPINNRTIFSFNKIRRITSTISGFQRRNRKSTIVIPVENADQKTADQFSKILSWCNRREAVLDTISEAFHGAIVTGLNLLHVWNDYRDDPISGDIKVDNCAYNSFLIDPYFRKRDLSDCNGIWRRSYLTKREILSILPKYRKELMDDHGFEKGDDEKFYLMPEHFNFDKGTLLPYDEYYYRAYRSQKMVVDTQTGESMEWKGKDDSDLKQFLQFFPQTTVVQQEVQTVKMAIVVDGKVMYDGPNNLGIDMYPFVPVFGHYNPQLSDYSLRIQGVVRALRDPQYLYNRTKVIELDILESRANTGWIAKANSLIDPKELMKTGQGRTILLKSTAEMSDVHPIPTQDIPAGFFQVSSGLNQEIIDIPGANEELLGSATDEKAGVLAMLRQGAGLTTMQPLFDQLDSSQKLLGKIQIQVIQNNFTPGKVKRIIEDEPTPQFYNKAFGKYDAGVEEGVDSTTQRQNGFAQLIELRERGVPIPNEALLEASTIQNKTDLIETIKQSTEQKQQIEQLQLRLALREQEARANLADSRAFADRGLGIERISRVEENQEQAIENRTEAQTNRTQSLLNIVKAIQELESADIAQIQQLLTIDGLVKSNVEPVEDAPVPVNPIATSLLQSNFDTPISNINKI